jgi:hypothetical protein
VKFFPVPLGNDLTPVRYALIDRLLFTDLVCVNPEQPIAETFR